MVAGGRGTYRYSTPIRVISLSLPPSRARARSLSHGCNFSSIPCMLTTEPAIPIMSHASKACRAEANAGNTQGQSRICIRQSKSGNPASLTSPPPSPSLFWGFVNSRGETLKGVWYFGTLPANTGGTEHPASGLWSRWQELSVPMYADVRNIYDSLHSFRCNHRPTRCTLRKAAKSMTGPTISMTRPLCFC